MYVRIALLAFLPALGGASALSVTSAGQAWLQAHVGTPGELDELKQANPEAFAVVQALLTKRSLGLLNSKHPTASFSDSAPAAHAQAVERGPEVFAKLAAPTEAQVLEPAAPHQVQLPYANVKSTHHDWLNWKPHSSVADDAMVANALSMVGGMKGSQAAPETPAMDAPAAVAIPMPSRESVPKASSDWGSIGSMLGLHKAVQRKATVPPEVVMSRPPLSMNTDSVHQAQEGTTEKHDSKDWNDMEKMKQNSDDKAVTNLLNMVAQLKGGKAEKLLKKHHTITSEDNALSNDMTAFGDAHEEEPSNPPTAAQSATEMVPPVMASSPVPVISMPSDASAAAPEKGSSWGSIGKMLGVQHKAVPTEIVKQRAEVETPPSSGMPAEVQALVSGNDSPVHRAAPKAKSDDWKNEMNMKQNADDTAVKSLLSMVAQLKGSKKAAKLAEKYDDRSTQEEENRNPLSNDMGIFGGGTASEAPADQAPVEVAPAVEVQEVPKASAAPARKENLFLTKSSHTPQEARHQESLTSSFSSATLVKENSYLKEFDLTDDSKRTEKPALALSATKSTLMSSWWSDTTEEKPQHKAMVPNKYMGGKLMSWLAPEQQEPVQKVSAKPQAPANPYIADLS